MKIEIELGMYFKIRPYTYYRNIVSSSHTSYLATSRVDINNSGYVTTMITFVRMIENKDM